MVRSRSPVGSSHSSSVRIGHDGARDRDALLLAARHFARVVLGAIGKTDDVQRGLDVLRAAPCASSLVSSSGSSTFCAADSIGIRL